LIEKYIETENISTRKGWGLGGAGNSLRLYGPSNDPAAIIIDVVLQSPIVKGAWYYAAVTRQNGTLTLY
jgi:hypothetical protein